ncbi:MAG TPA: choice-of-anchor D domain-containing protein, partial [Blastocatellia bacterium]|nr:choice-of-anchor D domain-containing protein [Blastocatellia bacterium]
MRLRSYKSLKQGIAVAIFFLSGLAMLWAGAKTFVSPAAAFQTTEELKLDDGSIETGVAGSGLIVVNRLTPSAYPSKLQTVRIFIGQAVGQPDPSGQQIRLIVFNGASNDAQPPAAPVLLLDQNVVIPPITFPGFIDFTIQNGPTIPSGDWYVGYQVPSPPNGLIFWLDKNGPQAQKTYFSFTGSGYQPLTSGTPATPANAAIRALVAQQAQANTPKINVTPGTLGFGNVNLNATADRTLTVSNVGTQSLNVTGITTTNTLFSVTSGTSFTVAAGAQQTVTVRFAPTAAGNQNGTLNIASNDPTQPAFAVPLSGAGIDVQPTARTVRAVNASGAPGGTVLVPVELVAQGNENALGFSLTFDPAILSNPQTALGSGATNASLNVNGLQIAQGRLGVAISQPSGQSFAAGTRQLLVVTFNIAGNTQATSTNVGFGDLPISREVVDVAAAPLQTTYTGGTVTISTGYEADVAPRPNGSGNGTVTISDWVQVGRFVAGLDQADAGSEFQRTDVAPKDSKGNGALSIADWVQAGRYAAGLDPVVTAGGPIAPAQLRTTEFELLNPETSPPSAGVAQQARTLRIGNANIERGKQGAVAVELNAQGNENALGFSISFDSTQLQFVSAVLGSGAAGATLNVNNLQTANGRVGIALALPAGQNFAAGTRQLVTLTFAAAASGSGSNFTVGFGDAPI